MTAPKVPKVVAYQCTNEKCMCLDYGINEIHCGSCGEPVRPLFCLDDIVAWLEDAAKLQIQKGTHPANFELAMIMTLAAELREVK